MKKTLTPILLITALLSNATMQAQSVLVEEDFTGGMSNAGFTIESGPVSDCDWVFAPDAIDSVTFNQDYTDTIPHGGGFDEFFVFIDSDECTGSTSNTVDCYLVSPAFDASGGHAYLLSFDHQFRQFTGSSATVQVYDGSTWTDVAHWEDNVGYPNPPTHETIDITAATGGSAAAQVRFRYFATWDWWWAIDNIRVETGTVGMTETAEALRPRLFPNPTTELITIEPAGAIPHQVILMDATGRSVRMARFTRTLNVSDLQPGAYTLLLQDDKGALVGRAGFLKQ